MRCARAAHEAQERGSRHGWTEQYACERTRQTVRGAMNEVRRSEAAVKCAPIDELNAGSKIVGVVQPFVRY